MDPVKEFLRTGSVDPIIEFLRSGSLPEDDYMDDDFEDEYEDVDADRADQLGFKPQKEVVYNKLLPYGGRQLDEESNAWFAAIKSNLARAVALRDIRPGFVTWSSRLHK